MKPLAFSLLRSWRRRWWRADARALAAYAGLRPAVVITGASEGIGLAITRAFLRSGSDVLMVARHPQKLEAAAATLLHEGATSRVDTLPLDVTAADAPERLDAALATLGAYPDILVNNAGIGLSGRFVGQAPADLDRLLALNIGAVTRLTRHLLPGQLVRGRGGIINIASLGGCVPGPQQAAYYASKAYVISLSEALAAETAGRGVHVMAVAPGPVDTRFHAKIGAETAPYRRFLPAHSTTQVARITLTAFGLGFRVVTPGLLDSLAIVAVRLLPHRLTVPIVGLLLRPLPEPEATPERPPSG